MSKEEHEFSLMLAIFSVAAGMVGVCLTGIGLLKVVSAYRKIETLTDELLAVNAIVFLACCLVSFLSFKAEAGERRLRLRKLADGLFFVGLVLMAVTCGLVALAFV